jgi:hypothetical protein
MALVVTAANLITFMLLWDSCVRFQAGSRAFTAET